MSCFRPGTLLLAPLQGVTDSIFRDSMTSLGGIDACLSVYARVSSQVLPAKSLLRLCPEAGMAGRTSCHVPVHLQLLGGQADLLAETALNGVQAGAFAIDINFGCPVKRVNRHDGGAELLKDPPRITKVLRKVRDTLPSSIPLSAKLRLGWAHAREAIDLAHAVEQGGAGFMTIHARTRQQLYHGQADWAALAPIRQAIGIPIVANGDIRSPEDLRRCAEVTGCESFMVGRGALARPELFRLLAGIQDDWWPSWKRLELLETYGLACARKNIPDINLVGRVKGWWRYMAEEDTAIKSAFIFTKNENSWVDLARALRKEIERLQNDG